MRIGELAKRSGVPIKTLRYYDEIGVLRPEMRDPVSRYRRYNHEALDMLALVKSAKSAGLSLDQIKRILIAARKGTACKEVVPLIESRIAEIDGAIRTLKELRTRLVRAVKKRSSERSRGGKTCPILAGLAAREDE